MREPDPFAARLIECGASAFAGMAASQMLELDPGLRERFAPDALATWKACLRVHLHHLATGLAEGDAECFSGQIGWHRTSFVARDVPLGDLRAALECMRRVLLEELPERAHASVSLCFDRALAALDREHVQAAGLSADQPEALLSARYIDAVLRGARREAARAILEPVRSGALDARRAILDVLLPAQREFGCMWHENRISVAAEHFGTATTLMVIHQLAAAAPARPENGRTVLTAAAAGDAHDLGLSAVALLFELDGWRVIHLGADVPNDDVVAGVADFRPELVALSATLDVQRPALRAAIAKLRELGRATAPDGASQPPRVLVGGRAFERDPSIWHGTGADAYAQRAEDALEIGRRLTGLPL